MPELNKVQALELYNDFEVAENLDQLFFARLGIEGAIARLREIKAACDEELIRRMKEVGQSSFEYDALGKKTKVWYSNKKKEIIKDTRILEKMLYSDNEGEREMARSSLAGCQAAWKIAKVREMQDTLGLDLIETTFEDKIEVKTIPVDKLKKGV